MDWESLLGVVAQLGVGGIFLYLYIQERDRRQQELEEKDSCIKDITKTKDMQIVSITSEKDRRIETLTGHVMELQKESIRVIGDVHSALENNTRVIDSLTGRVTDMLIRSAAPCVNCGQSKLEEDM